MRHFIAGLTSLALLAGCDRHLTMETVPPAVAAGPVSYLSISDTTMNATEIVVIGNADVRGGAAIGSFRAHVHFDPRALVYVGDEPLAGGIRATNADSTSVIVAGATLGGFENGRLFALRFRVIGPRSADAIAMVLDELNGTDYVSQIPMLHSSSTVRLDRTVR